MKTKILLSTLLSFVFCLLSSQVPQGFNYQAIARDVSGNPIVSTPLQVKLTIKPDSSGTGIIWEEIHASVTTNSFGLFTVTLGKGARQISSTVAKFSDIDWLVTPKFLRTDIYYYSDWKFMGTTRLYSVPYAMVANDLGGTLDKLKVRDNGTNPMDSALFEVKNKNGQTVFAVYNEGVRVYVDDGIAKGATKGGFAIGSFGTEKGTSDPLFVVNADSIRGYIKQNPVKGVKGGFAIGSFDNTKSYKYEEYLQVTRDSTRVYINDLPGKGVKGGFAIGGFDNTKGSFKYLNVTSDSTRINTADTIKGFGVGSISSGVTENYLKLTPKNYFIGHNTGKKITTGKYNSVMGYQSGANLTSGYSNILIGYQAGNKLTTGYCNEIIGSLSGSNLTIGIGNIFVGSETGQKTVDGSFNVFVGNAAGTENKNGFHNTYLGSLSGLNSTSANRNTFIGCQAGMNTNSSLNTLIGAQAGMQLFGDGGGNTFIGYQAGSTTIQGAYNVCIGLRTGGAPPEFGSNELGNHNVYVGTGAGYRHGGDNNVFIGTEAGGKIDAGQITGSGNVFIGDQAGFEEFGSNKLYIDNSGTTSPLIYGDFTDGSEKLVFSGNVGIGITPNTKLSIAGLTGSATGSTLIINGNNVYYLTSKKESKENIQPLTDNFDKILKAKPVSFKDKATGMSGIGYIAEEFEKAGLQNLLVYEGGNLVSLRYDLISVYSLEIIKEQQQLIEKQQNEIDHLKSLENDVLELKSLVNTLITNQAGQKNR